MTQDEKREWNEVKTMITRLDEHVRIKIPGIEGDVATLRKEVKGIVGTIVKATCAMVTAIIGGVVALFQFKG